MARPHTVQIFVLVLLLALRSLDSPKPVVCMALVRQLRCESDATLRYSASLLVATHKAKMFERTALSIVLLTDYHICILAEIEDIEVKIASSTENEVRSHALAIFSRLGDLYTLSTVSSEPID